MIGGLISGLLRRNKPRSIEAIAADLAGSGVRQVAGQVVTERTALQVSTVLACVEVLATACSVPELHVMRDLGDGKKEQARDKDIFRILHRRPNELQTSLEFRETMTMHLALTGNAFAVPVRDLRNGAITELWPVMPGMVSILQNERYELTYEVNDDFGYLGRFRHDQILHLRNRSWDRVRGLSAVKHVASAIGLSMAAEENVAKLHENGGRPGGILTTEQQLSPEAIDRIKTAFDTVAKGAGRYRTALLDSGLDYKPMAQSQVDSQTNETRRLQVEEICRGFGVFPQMVGYADKTATFASAEAFFAAHNRITVRKWQQNWRQRLDEFILDGDGPLFAEFDNRDMLVASVKDQGEFYARALGTGGGVPFMTVNEVRAERGLPPVEGGDELREPAASTVAPPGDESDDTTA